MFFSKKVRVRFVSAESGSLLREAELLPEQLPESFAASTQLQLSGQPFQVTKAEPMTRAEYAKTRRLTIVLRKVNVQPVSPQDILFSLPTLNDFLPAVAPGSTKLGQHVLELHEDDWRQVEFVARELGEVVAGELAQIRRILASRTGPGFKTIHVREQPKSPLGERHLTLAALARALGDARAYDGVAYQSGAGLVAGGFAFDCGATRVYGVASDGVVTTLALQRAKDAPLHAFAAIAHGHALLLVDWCAAQLLDV